MSTFYESPNDYRNYLCHYGVKGMKWRNHKNIQGWRGEGHPHVRIVRPGLHGSNRGPVDNPSKPHSGPTHSPRDIGGVRGDNHYSNEHEDIDEEIANNIAGNPPRRTHGQDIIDNRRRQMAKNFRISRNTGLQRIKDEAHSRAQEQHRQEERHRRRYENDRAHRRR